MIPRPPSSPLFPYTTPFRSIGTYHQGLPKLPDHMETAEWASAEHPFRLVTSPARNFLNSTFAETPTSRKDRKSTRLNSSHGYISYAVFCLKKKRRRPTHYSG